MEITNVAAFLDYYKNLRRRTLEVAACIPPNKIEWSCREGKFTLGDLLRHIAAIERYLYAETVRSRPSGYTGHGSELAEGHDAVMAFLERTHAESLEIFGRLTDEQLQERCLTPGGASIRIWKWLRAMCEHEIHHRGQLYTYLGMLSVETPPLFGLTSEEVRALTESPASGA